MTTATAPSTRASSLSPRSSALAGWASLVGRLILAGVFGYASLSKISDPAATVRAVRAYKILASSLTSPFGHALPWVELAVAVLLVAGYATRIAGAASTLLLAMFIGGIISVDARGLSIDCGCFGGGGVTANPHYTSEIIRDALLLLVAVAVMVIPVSRFALDPQPPVPVQEAGDDKDARRRTKVAQNRFAADRAKFSLRLRINSAVAVAAVVIMALIGIGVGHASVAGTVIVPPSATAQGGILVGKASAPHHVIAYEDPQCPICGDFEKASGATLQKAVAAGQASVEYRMMSFLGPESVRADAALGAAANEGKFEQLRAAMFAHQPAEKTGGYTISDLLDLGKGVGLTDAAYTTAVKQQTYAPWAKSVEDKAEKTGVNGTPTVTVDGGKSLDLQTVLLKPTVFGKVVGVSRPADP